MNVREWFPENFIGEEGEHAMRYRIDIVKKDAEGKEYSRSTVGEYSAEVDALHEMQNQEKVLRTFGNNDTYVEMLQLQ